MPQALAKNSGSAITGLEELSKVLRQLSKDMQTELLVPVVREVGEKIEDAMRFNVPVRTGSLYQSLDTKVIRYPKDGNAVAITGPRRKMSFQTSLGIAKPSKYAHLVEFGHVDRQGRFHGPTKPFMRPAVAAIAPIALEMMARKLWKGMERSAVKAGAKLG